MRATPLLLAIVAVAAGCGDGNGGEPAETVTIQETVTTAAPDPAPVATVPEPGETTAARCDTAGLDAPGLESLVADGVDCSEAESVLLNWLQGCVGQEGPCEPVPGYSCVQERFAGSASEVECVKGDASIRFRFL